VHYAQIVRRDSALRRIIADAGVAVQMAYDGEEPAAIRGSLIRSMAGREDEEIPIIAATDALKELEDEQREWQESGKAPEGIDPILPSLRRSLRNGVLRPGSEFLIGGDTGVGKSMLALFIAVMNAYAGKRVLFFGTEMLAKDLAERFAPMLAPCLGISLDNWDLVHGQGADALHLLREEMERIMTDRLFIVDRATQVEEVELLAHHIIALYGDLDLLVIDYKQMLTTDEKTYSETQKQDIIVEALRRLGLRLGATILSVSSFRKADGEPTIDDFRGSKTLTYATSGAWAVWVDKDTLEKEAMRYPDTEMPWRGNTLKICKNSRYPAIEGSMEGVNIPVIIDEESAQIREYPTKGTVEGL